MNSEYPGSNNTVKQTWRRSQEGPDRNVPKGVRARGKLYYILHFGRGSAKCKLEFFDASSRYLKQDICCKNMQ